MQEAFTNVQTVLSGNSFIPSCMTAFFTHPTHLSTHFDDYVCGAGWGQAVHQLVGMSRGRGHSPAMGEHYSGIALYKLPKNQDQVSGSTKESCPVFTKLSKPVSGSFLAVVEP